MKYHAGILDGKPEWDRLQLLVLGHTPGVPLEWIYAAARLGWRRRTALRDMLASSKTGEFPSLGQMNAASIAQGDGWKMLEAVCPGYAGPVPLWSQIELQNSARTDQANADLLGVERTKVWRWRKRNVFDPLTGSRIVPNRGRSIMVE